MFDYILYAIYLFNITGTISACFMHWWQYKPDPLIETVAQMSVLAFTRYGVKSAGISTSNLIRCAIGNQKWSGKIIMSVIMCGIVRALVISSLQESEGCELLFLVKHVLSHKTEYIPSKRSHKRVTGFSNSIITAIASC